MLGAWTLTFFCVPKHRLLNEIHVGDFIPKVRPILGHRAKQHAFQVSIGSLILRFVINSPNAMITDDLPRKWSMDSVIYSLLLFRFSELLPEIVGLADDQKWRLIVPVVVAADPRIPLEPFDCRKCFIVTVTWVAWVA